MSGPFYRAAGMTYLRYANISADLLRNVLKEPLKAKAALRQTIHFKYSSYLDGKQGKQVFVDIKDGMKAKKDAEITL
ncbi:MAG: hypothetical protein WDW38_010268 [Sanguina aurantia]